MKKNFSHRKLLTGIKLRHFDNKVYRTPVPTDGRVKDRSFSTGDSVDFELKEDRLKLIAQQYLGEYFIYLFLNRNFSEIILDEGIICGIRTQQSR